MSFYYQKYGTFTGIGTYQYTYRDNDDFTNNFYDDGVFNLNDISMVLLNTPQDFVTLHLDGHNTDQLTLEKVQGSFISTVASPGFDYDTYGHYYTYGTPLPIGAAFDVNGGVPVEAEPAPAPTSFTEPPAIPTQCWDGSTIYAPAVCPVEPSPTPTVEPSPMPSPEPQPSESPTPTIEPSPQPSEPSPQSSEPVVQPSETSSPIPVPSFSSPSEYPWQPEGPVAVPSLDPEPEISYPEPLTLDPIEIPSPDLDLPSIDLPSDNTITEITDTEIDTFIEDFTESGVISDIETEQLINTFLGDGFISEDEVSGLSDSLTEDGVLTEDERELIVDVILEQADGNAISTDLINELGLDYEDLPDDQPVALENGVILFAEVADALEIFENPSEILGAVFTDPGKALTAVANIGADMTPEKREESQRVVVASVITVQVVAATNLATGRIR